MKEQTVKQKKTRKLRRPVFMGPAGLVLHPARNLFRKAKQKRFSNNHVSVCERVFSERLKTYMPDPSCLHLNYQNPHYTQETVITVPGGQENRHHLFVLLAKNYRATKDRPYLAMLKEQFIEWNREHPFLTGTVWEETTETAYRIISWSMMMGFLDGMDDTEELIDALSAGIVNMASHLADHYSVIPGDKDHPVVEMFAILQAGILFGEERWKRIAIKNMTRALTSMYNNEGIGVDRNLRAQALSMEAAALAMRLLKVNRIPAPENWNGMLERMCRYLCSCRGSRAETVIEGEDDGSKLLDLQGGEDPDGFYDYYAYVLSLCSLALEKNYTVATKDSGYRETLDWLYPEEAGKQVLALKRYTVPEIASYPRAGITMVHSSDGKLLFAFDHAARSYPVKEDPKRFNARSTRLFADGCELLDAEAYPLERKIRRELLFDRDDRLIITDTAMLPESRGSNGQAETAFFTIGPWCGVSVHGSNVHIHGIDGTEVLIHFREGAETVRQTKSEFTLAYGKYCETAALEVEFRGKLVTSITAR